MKLKPKACTNYKFKPIQFPDGFTLSIDSREQLPLFQRTKDLMKIVKTLHLGDYSIRGFEDQFAIERKQLSDFYGYIGREETKTRKKLTALSALKFSALIIEANSLQDIFQFPYATVHPEAVRGRLVSINVRFGIHIYMSADRRQLERWVLDRAVKFWKIMKEV